MAGQKFTLTFDAQLNVSQMKGALAEVQSSLNKLQLPQNMGKGIYDTFSKLSEEVKKFEGFSGQKFGSEADLGKLEKNIDNILKLFNKLKTQIGNIQGLDSSSLEKLFPEKVTKNIESAKAALSPYLDALKKVQQEIAKYEKKQADAQSKIDATNSKTVVSPEKYKETLDSIKAVKAELDDLKVKEAEVTEKVNEKMASLKDPINRPGKILPGLQKELEDIQTQIKTAEEALKGLNIQKESTITGSKQTEDIGNYTTKLEEAKSKLQELKTELASLESTGEGSWLAKLVEQFTALTGVDFSQTTASAETLGEAIRTYINQQMQQLVSNANGANGALENFGQAAKSGADATAKFGNETRNALSNLRDVETLKSRIQYFFGLSNAINLAKRAIRGAFDTIKDLDKAMTETAVVTNFSVKDMWSQLPAYTKQANELGVTTLEAYQAATLYYQQGLKANEVNALSTETLKMARIAGLEAAEATDRMTNALRGFNMELTAANAQRVDDVYSELAANTASNVDEISTAMTKVASLANNANMEFETTSAFLAQIIETTRESAETAGTALKTVVARFSEVKKLVDEGTLRGQDEEGEVIDVNKVGQALRTAGIDLNKYFLGEVGLDDIFMELASKWDSLTSLQQRYIATQAAGSRQQSRFIAMMSNYARTQELVDKAYASTGAAARQFEKTQESLQSKLARLKNAWNEFLMGLANNQIVKAAVDILTGLLNAVNSLTSAFGDGVGSILKWLTAIMAFSGLKSLFRQGGLVEKGLMSLLSGTTIGEDLAKKGLGQAAGQTFGQAFFSGFKNVGSKMWGGLADLGSFVTFGKLSGVAAGLMGIATALAAITTAAVIANAAYSAWLKNTDKGKIKLAETYAESVNTIATSMQQASTRIKDASEKMQEYKTALENATTAEERNTAIQNQNDYIASLIKEDATYAQYIRSTITEGGQIYLTLDEVALASAVDKIAEGAVQASAYADIANANVAEAQSNYYKNLLEGVDLNERTLTLNTGGLTPFSDDVTRDFWYVLAYKFLGTSAEDQMSADYINSVFGGDTQKQVVALSDADIQRYTQMAASQTAADITAENYRTQAAQKLLTLNNVGIDSDLLNVVAQAFGKSFDTQEWQNEVFAKRDSLGEIFTTRSALAERYQQVYGVAPSENIEKNDLQYDIAYAEVLQEKLGTRIPDLVNLIQDENGQLLLEAFTHAADKPFDVDQLKTAYENLTDEQKKVVDEIFKPDEQNPIEDIFTKTVESYNKETENIQNKFRKTLERSGRFTDTTLNAYTKQLSRSQMQKINKIADTLTNYDQQFQDIILANVVKAELNPAALTEDYQNFINSLMYAGDNPITMFNVIAEGANSADESVRNLAASLKSINTEQLSNTNQVSYLLSSDSYKAIEESVQKLLESNSQITSKNITDLANESSMLATLLDNGVISAQGLANVINSLESGSLTILDLNDDVLKLADSYYDLEDAVADAHEFINNFSFDNQYIDTYDFIGKVIESLKELQSIGAYGEMDKYLSVFFKDLPEDINGAIAAIAKLQGRNGGTFWTEIFGTIIDSAGDMDTTPIVDAFSAWLSSGNKGNLIDFLRQRAQEYFKELGIDTELSDTYMQMMLSNLLGHDKDNHSTAKALAKTYLSNILDGFLSGSNLDVSKIDVIKAKIAEMAKLLKLDPSELFKSWIEDNGITIGEGIDLSQLFNFDNIDPSSLSKLQTSFSDIIKNALKAGLISEDDIAGLDINSAMQTLLEKIGLKNGTFDLETFNLNIKSIVPEIESGALTAEQVTSQILAQTGPIKIPVKYTIVGFDESGKETQKEETTTISISNLADIEKIVNDLGKFNPAESWNLSSVQEVVTTISDTIASLGENTKLSNVTTAIAEAKQSATDLSTALGEDVKKKVFIEPQQSSITIGSGTSTVTLSISAMARGGVVQSAAGGTVKPGLALTGEFAPEIVWNAEKGYAYLAGKNGPEINNLQPGDRVFNGEQTRQILKRSGMASFAKGTEHDLISSYSGASWGPTGRSGGGSGSGKDKKGDDWSNELDWLYNLLNDIAESERQQAIYAAKFEAALKDTSKTGRDLYNLTQQQLGKLISQRVGYEAQLEQRQKELAQLEKDASKEKVGGKKGATFDKYARYNEQDNTVEIDWDKINKIKDKDQYDAVVEYIEKLESAKQSRDEAEQALLDIDSQIEELQQQYLSKYLDFEKRVMDAVVAQYQENIDNLSELNDTINSTNADIISSMQEQINLERQIRDNTQKEQDISDMEAQLAFLQRDTSGANQTAILDLQEKLRDAQQDYSDTLLDQSIDQLSKSNEEAQKQREQQIEIMQSQLDYMQKNGLLWDEVNTLIGGGFTEDGSIKEGSDLYKLLQNADAWSGMSQAQRLNWADELTLDANQVGAYLLQQLNGAKLNQGNIERILSYMTDPTQYIAPSGYQDPNSLSGSEKWRIREYAPGEHGTGKKEDAYTWTQAQKDDYRQYSLTPEAIHYTDESPRAPGGKPTAPTSTPTPPSTLASLLTSFAGVGQSVEIKQKTNANTLVRNDDFLKLANVAPNWTNAVSKSTTTTNAPVTFNLDVQVDQLANDYDVDELVSRLKEDLYNSAMYKNGNVLSLLR